MSNQQSPNALTETILIAEDSTPNRAILVHLLKKLGFEVIECSNGRIAWETLKKPETKVAAILSDMMMPEMDGMELLKNCRETDKLKTIPFIFVTAISDKNKIIIAKSHHANGYILKPVTFQRVTEKLQEVFPKMTFPKIAA